MVKVLMLHGWTNRRLPDVWHHQMTTALRRAGHQVLYPQFPSPDEPSLQEWQDLLVAELKMLHDAGDGETVVIGHSLGCLNWIQAAATGKITEPADRVLFVAPADPDLLQDIEGIAVDLTNPSVAAAVHASTKSLTILGSDADPWTPRGMQATFGDPLGVEAVIIPGARHFTAADGWGQWSGVIDWVADPTADITKR
ncbi:MAG: hypothetical protein RLY88_420 [Actinomycetota bacterium]|jgi:predicted alpha/beta hydrolase family esterase